MTAGSVAVPTIVPLRAPVLGQHKTTVDSNTKIELHSDTDGAIIFFTVNGAKPEPFQSVGNIQAKSTFTYREPFCLPAGKRTIKALARTEDGRESHTVTKVFDVEPSDSGENNYEQSGLEFIYSIPASEHAKREVQRFAGDMVTSKEAWEDVQRIKNGDGRRKPPTGPRFLSSRLDQSNSSAVLNNMLDQELYGTRSGGGVTLDSRVRYKLPPDDATQALRLQRETDFLKCIYCFAPRPADPFVRYCNDCGNALPPLPQTRLPPPEPGQMGTCVQCKSVVPLNTPQCLVCEAVMDPQLIPQSSVRLADKLLCTVCGTANQSNLRTCVTCASSLAKSAKLIRHKPPTGLGGMVNGFGGGDVRGEGPMICHKCARVNNPDARFCDWCGTKPAQLMADLLTCPKCRSVNGAYALFCGNCGVTMCPPNRSNGVGYTRQTQSATRQDVSCQTVGLFYPSQKEIDHKHKNIEEKLSIEKEMKDRKPLLTAVSPGRGYWRKQMDHICGHLKAHASNSADFRALIAEPRMGRLLSASVSEDGYELCLTVSFAVRGTDDSTLGKNVYSGSTALNGGKPPYLSSFTRSRADSINSYGSMESLRNVGGGATGRSSRNSARKSSARRPKSASATRKKTTVKKSPLDELTIEDKKLLQEVGKKGEGNADVIQELIDEGASVNALNKDSQPVLHVAALNKHIDAVAVLVQNGADVDRRGPTHGNTALQDVISLGPAALPMIDALVGCGASPTKKNDKGDTAFDLAVKQGYDSVAKRLATYIGQATLGRMTRPKSAGAQDI